MPSEISFSEENEVYLVNIPPRREKEARKLYQAFYFVERENIANGLYKATATKAAKNDPEEENEESDDLNASILSPETSEEYPEDESQESEDVETKEYFNPVEESEEEDAERGVYVFKADRYKDLAGTVWIFLFFGIIGLVFVILNMAGILSLLNGWIPNTVMGALFIGFLYVAFSTKQKADKIREEIAVENKLTEEINAWLKETVTKDYLASLSRDDISEELNYIKMTDTIKEQLTQQFGKQNLSYLDRLVEEFYTNNF